MNVGMIMGIARSTIEVMLWVSVPILGIGLLVGLIISIFQAVTQIQEVTLTFVPKIVVTFLCLIFFGPWMLNKLIQFTVNIYTNFPQWLR
ncbi:MAG: flagellar biosynthetic protein FliQ [Deltaproteobacteria bacterium]|nr:MAG: flagellar biosynthetic protein FliQ [Deltaproteobacteria bacterium]RLB07111.1 MAG: flagellar biosynthetic protein FliQ [Deltaproteobacteria bacterium]